MDTNKKSMSGTAMSVPQIQLMGVTFRVPESHTPEQFIIEALEYFEALHAFNSEILLSLQSKCPKNSIEHQCLCALHTINLSNELIEELEFFESIANDVNTIEHDNFFEIDEHGIDIELHGFQDILVSVSGSIPTNVKVYLDILKFSYRQLYDLPLEYLQELRSEMEKLDLSNEREGLAIEIIIEAKLEMIKQGIN